MYVLSLVLRFSRKAAAVPTSRFRLAVSKSVFKPHENTLHRRGDAVPRSIWRASRLDAFYACVVLSFDRNLAEPTHRRSVSPSQPGRLRAPIFCVRMNPFACAVVVFSPPGGKFRRRGRRSAREGVYEACRFRLPLVPALLLLPWLQCLSRPVHEQSKCAKLSQTVFFGRKRSFFFFFLTLKLR